MLLVQSSSDRPSREEQKLIRKQLSIFSPPVRRTGSRFPDRRQRKVDIPSYLYPHITTILEEAKPYIKNAIASKVERSSNPRQSQDIVDWASEHFYIPSTSSPIELLPHQRAILRLAFTRDSSGHFPYQTVIYSTIKQSGKTTISGLVLRWYAETGVNHSTLYAIGNDGDQAKERGFKEARISIELTPEFDHEHDRLPGEWDLKNKESMRCLLTGSTIRALPVDAKGEAGGKPAIAVWTELWGIVHEDAKRFWIEMTPIPTIPDSVRFVETYAGYFQESTVLYQLYQQGLAGRQLTAGELSERTGEPINAFSECASPDDLTPIWINDAASILMYWDTGVQARRMPWQLDDRGAAYYRSQEETLLPNAYRRLHENEWVASESQFISPESWDACYADIQRLTVGDNTPIVIGVDAATSSDCFAIVAVSRHPTRHDEVAVRAVRVFDPKELGHDINYDDAERFLRVLCKGGHMGTDGRLHPPATDSMPATDGCALCEAKNYSQFPAHNVAQITYDPYQLESMMQRLRADSIVWCDPFSQANARLASDRALYDAIINRRIAHNGDLKLREHILNAGAKITHDDSAIRLVKVAQDRKIDAAVALSMASARCLYLIL